MPRISICDEDLINHVQVGKVYSIIQEAQPLTVFTNISTENMGVFTKKFKEKSEKLGNSTSEISAIQTEGHYWYGNNNH